MTDRLEKKHAAGWPTVRRLFDIEQAAEVAQEPLEEIWRRIKSGELRVYHLGGGRVRIDEVDLLASIEPRNWSGDGFLAGRQRDAWRCTPDRLTRESTT